MRFVTRSSRVESPSRANWATTWPPARWTVSSSRLVSSRGEHLALRHAHSPTDEPRRLRRSRCL